MAECTSHFIPLKENEIFNPSPQTHEGNIADNEAGHLLTRRSGKEGHPELHGEKNGYPGTPYKKLRNLYKEISKKNSSPPEKKRKSRSIISGWDATRSDPRDDPTNRNINRRHPTGKQISKSTENDANQERNRRESEDPLALSAPLSRHPRQHGSQK